MRALDETRTWIGRPVRIDGADEVSRNDVRRKLEVYGFDCPLYSDDAIARALGYRAAIAPAAMTALWELPAYWVPGEPPLFAPGKRDHDGAPARTVPSPYGSSVNAASETTFDEPLYSGDRLYAVTTLVEVKERRTRLGEGAFLSFETVTHKSSGERVAVRRHATFHYDKRAEPAAAAEAAPPLDETVLGDVPVDWSVQRRFGDVRVGDVLPPVHLWLSYQRIVMSVAADRMFSGIHHNRDAARAAGLPDIIFNTRGYEMLFEIALRRWIGLAGRLRRLGPFRMIANAHPGDTLTCAGTVTAATPRGDGGEVTIQLAVRSTRRPTAAGEALVMLPR